MQDEQIDDDILLFNPQARKIAAKQLRPAKTLSRTGRSRRSRAQRAVPVGGIHQRRNRRIAW